MEIILSNHSCGSERIEDACCTTVFVDGFKIDVKAQDCGGWPPFPPPTAPVPPRDGGIMDGAFLERILGLAPPFPSLGSGETVRQERADWNVLSPLGDKGLLNFKNKH